MVCRGRGVFCTGAPGTTMDLHTRLFVGLCCVLRSACHAQAAQCADCTCFVGALRQCQHQVDAHSMRDWHQCVSV